MRSKLFKFLIGIVLGLTLVAFTMAAGFLYWVATGPRSLGQFARHIETAFNNASSDYSFKIGDPVLIWENWKHPVNLRLRDVRVLTKAGDVFSAFPEIAVSIDVWALPQGQILPTSITLEKPVISLFQNTDHSISFGFRQPAPATETAPTETIPLIAVLAPLLADDSNNTFRKLRRISIREADVSVGNTRKGVFLDAKKVNFAFRRDRQGVIQASANAQILYDDFQSTISAQFKLDAAQSVAEGKVEFSGIMPGTLVALFSDDIDLMPIDLPLSGTIMPTFTMKDGTLQRAHFQLNGGGGTISSEHLESDLQVTALSAEGQVSNNFKDIQIDSLLMNMDEISITANGVVSLNDHDVAVRGTVGAKNVTASQARLFWPPSLSPISRDWIVNNITEGVVPEASARININYGDLSKPILPKEAVDATIALVGARIRYLPEHPEVHNVAGTIHIDGVGLSADIASAEYMKDTKLSNGHLLIADLNADNPHIVVDFQADTTARDAVALLKLPRLNHAAHLNLNGEAAGSATVAAKLGFDFYAPRDAEGNPIAEPDIEYDVTANMKNMVQPGFMKKFDIKDGDGTLTINNKELVFKGKGDVNGASVSSATVRYVFDPAEKFDTYIDVKATAPASVLPKFGYPSMPFLKGTLGVTADVKLGPKSELSKASIDLTNASFAAEDIGWDKADKEPASLDITAEKKDDLLQISSFHLQGKQADLKGSAMLTKDFSHFQKIAFEKIIFGATNLTRLNFEKIPGGFLLDAAGETADISAFMKHDPNEKRTFSFASFPAVQFKTDVGKVILDKNRALMDMKGELRCDTRICSSANISGKSGGKPFSFRILRNPKGKRQLSLRAENAGEFLRALDIHDGVEEGDLTIIGNYDDSGKSSVLRARLDITEHTIRRAPVLAKILSLASLTGFIDVLQGNGIRFSRLSAPFTLTNDVITFENAKTRGPSIGLTLEGTITLPEIMLDLKGTVVPAYALNNAIGKVPIVGTVLTGGEGGGVFATNYSVKGPESDPSVTVNPLSMLTPGFLRGLFDVFDAPKGETTTPQKKTN